MLLDATRQCIIEHGLAGTTSRLITSKAGVNLAAITYHFGSKDDLIASALLDGLRTWLQPALDLFSGDGDATTRSIAGIQQLMVTYDTHRPMAPAYLEAFTHAMQSEPLRTGIIALWDELRVHLVSDMGRMRAAGSLPEWVDIEAMATLFIAVANGLVLHVTIDADGPPIGVLAAQFAALLIAARSPGEPS